MKGYAFNWQKFLILIGVSFGFGFLAMIGTDEGLMYYLNTFSMYDAILCIFVFSVILIISFEK
ncbi:hypothetical protein ACM2RH_002529 [Acinetobacter baumannii]|jgi:hypothetical protein|uniref:Uncharacterized protein n=1 Tax=Acinetobacter baumannii TaxID=470 RepID=A0AB73FD05_ACIBA|nr:hypothetical protein [Acinetobacter ursingii]EKV2410480.1 hypothetical protein [Acinetobacter baumannii]OTU10935.1 hypothetical protein CAT65_12855 [Acinetobacter pittii]EKV2425994.1 hypothetical protein [Acinetobacter baumannii]EKV7933866.1 hypothetical protein [Acinetobacter baumannii]EKW1394841.1 hypothetical protein [Acinetobacter baumannii]